MANRPVDIKLVIYIDQELLKQDTTTGLPNLANLTLARKVGGVANVVFQSKSPTDFSDQNDFTWQQSYQIGAYKKQPESGVLVRLRKISSSVLGIDMQQVGSGARKVSIAPNSMCDWTGVNNVPLQYMPDPVQADAGWFEKFNKSMGMFGTKNQPREWLNAIYCSTGNVYQPIYTEVVKPASGLTYRGFKYPMIIR